jgi:hypothetical protein
LIALETLANALHEKSEIAGMKIGDIEHKISQYADDTCLTVADDCSMTHAFTGILHFTKCTGLK